MYELHREISLAGGTASAFPNNLSTFKNSAKQLTFAAVAHRHQINTISWDKKLEGMTNDSIQAKDPTGGSGISKPLVVVQVRYCLLPNRANPLLAVCTVNGVLIFEWNGTSLLAWHPVNRDEDENFCFTKGIATLADYVLIGSFTGDIFVFSARDNTVKLKTTLKEHKAAISDISTDYETFVASISGDGTVICWDANLKILNRISTGQPLGCVAVYSNYILCGTVLGQVLIYSGKSGEIVADVAAHARTISSIDVAFESGLFLTVSEDSFVRVWKTHIREKKPEPFEVESVYSHCMENVPLIGGCFNDARGASFAVTGFDIPTIYYFKYKKSDKAKSK